MRKRLTDPSERPRTTVAASANALRQFELLDMYMISHGDEELDVRPYSIQ